MSLNVCQLEHHRTTLWRWLTRHRSTLTSDPLTRLMTFTVAFAAALHSGPASACAVGSGTFTAPVPPAITSYFNSNNDTEYVIYVDTNGVLWSLSHYGSGSWNSTQLTSEGTFAPGSPLLAYPD